MHDHPPKYTDSPHDAVPCEWIDLGDGHGVGTCRLPAELIPSDEQFEVLWGMHPAGHRTIVIHGRRVLMPRWQEVYGRDYTFSGQTAVALPVPPILVPFQEWAQAALDARLNGLVLNWYDGAQGHYIGPHCDKHSQLVAGTPIISISLGEQRIFRLSREEKRGGKKVVDETHDLTVEQGSVIVLPWATNIRWKHAVPRFARYRGRRISITIRAFR
jgi:alkylated DNA repair dioxygenase AlkB